VQATAKTLVNYIRHATWISTNLAGDITKDGMGTNFAYTPEEKSLYASDPTAFLAYRKHVERSVNSVYKLMLSGSAENTFLFNLVDRVMRAKLAKSPPELVSKLIPEFEIGCRRLSPGDGYLEAMQEGNARWEFEPIIRVTEKGIVTESGEEEFDLIVTATGFNTTYIPPWELVGRDERRLDVEWREKPEAYFSMCAGGIPNYFFFGGPNAPIGHGSVPAMLAWCADYMLDWVEKIAKEDIKYVTTPYQGSQLCVSL
jgi:cation diffusion facilitator CzcD-associated flavoprotein CzcO